MYKIWYRYDENHSFRIASRGETLSNAIKEMIAQHVVHALNEHARFYKRTICLTASMSERMGCDLIKQPVADDEFELLRQFAEKYNFTTIREREKI